MPDPTWRLPQRFAPMLAGENRDDIVSRACADPDRYACEPKYDGVRCITIFEPGGHIDVLSRHGRRTGWLRNAPHLDRELRELADRLPLLWDGTVLDGELAGGTLGDTLTLLSHYGRHDPALAYFVFDLPFLGGADFRGHSWSERRATLERLAEAFVEPMQITPLLDPEPELLFKAVDAGFEGVIVKERGSRYRARSRVGWTKVKPADWSQSRPGRRVGLPAAR